MRGVAFLGLCALAALVVSGCESTQTKSARLARSGAGKAQLTTVKAGAVNASIDVASTQVLAGEGTAAAVVQLRNTGATPQAAVGVQIEVDDAKGKPVYRNDVAGLQPALQQMAYLAPGKAAFWVDDQVVAATPAKSVKVRIGAAKGKAPPGPAPTISLQGVRLDHDNSGTFATGTVHNESKLTQLNLPVYAVARRGARIVAAGRAIVEKLAPDPQPKPTIFRIFFIGNPAGAALDVHAVPTVLR